MIRNVERYNEVEKNCSLYWSRRHRRLGCRPLLPPKKNCWFFMRICLSKFFVGNSCDNAQIIHTTLLPERSLRCSSHRNDFRRQRSKKNFLTFIYGFRKDCLRLVTLHFFKIERNQNRSNKQDKQFESLLNFFHALEESCIHFSSKISLSLYSYIIIVTTRGVGAFGAFARE